MTQNEANLLMWNEIKNLREGAGKVNKVTRFEVIDHREKGKGRIFVAWPCKIRLSYQDDERTLKVFVTESLND